MIKIYNLKYKKPEHEYDIRIDRQSILGNPYKMNNESERENVCLKYERYFRQNLENSDFYNELIKLKNLYEHYGKLNLFCWCAPKMCHGITIKNYIEKMVWSFH